MIGSQNGPRLPDCPHANPQIWSRLKSRRKCRVAARLVELDVTPSRSRSRLTVQRPGEEACRGPRARRLVQTKKAHAVGRQGPLFRMAKLPRKRTRPVPGRHRSASHLPQSGERHIRPSDEQALPFCHSPPPGRTAQARRSPARPP